MNLVLRYMRVGDIAQVIAIDKQCFDPAWSPDSYSFEITESRVSHMVVLEQRVGEGPQEPARPDNWLARLGGRLRTGGGAVSTIGTILGYGGLWKIEAEAHVSTIATHPEWRGNGYGEILLAGMIGKALRLRADFIVLEVRVSNSIAQSLYHKYGFCRFGRKRNYYGSDKEDAWDMRVTLDKAARRQFARQYDTLRLQHRFEDAYSGSGKPRLRR